MDDYRNYRHCRPQVGMERMANWALDRHCSWVELEEVVVLVVQVVEAHPEQLLLLHRVLNTLKLELLVQATLVTPAVQ